MNNVNALAIVNQNADEFSVKKAIYNLANIATTKLSSMVNKEFTVKLVTFTEADVIDRETGEYIKRERALVVDTNGETYHTVGNGLLNSLHDLCKLFATEKNGFYTFDGNELKVTVTEKPTPNGHTHVITLL